MSVGSLARPVDANRAAGAMLAGAPAPVAVDANGRELGSVEQRGRGAALDRMISEYPADAVPPPRVRLYKARGRERKRV